MTTTDSEKKYLSKEEIKNQIIDSLNEQIKMRKDLLQQMVGTLYPGILADEIDYLQTLLSNIKATVAAYESNS